MQQNDNIIIIPADKGRATVILNKEDYIRKCNEHLENGPYIKIKKDPTSSVVSQITRKLSVLRDNKLIDKQQYLKLKPTGHTAKHCWKYNHDFDWNNKRVLDFEKNWKTRIIKEAIYSEENKQHINGVSFRLPTIWKPILQKNKEKRNKLENSTAKNTSPSNPRPDTSAMQTNQSAMTIEHFDPPCKHINTTHFTIHTCLMMGKASLETSPKKQHDSRHDKLR